MQKITVKTTGSVIYKASNESETEKNWHNFKMGVPANLKLVEGFLYVDPKNSDLLVSLTKGYSGYAYAINETQFLNEQLNEELNSENKIQAIYNYTKAFEYGLRYLENEGIQFSDLIEQLRSENGLRHFLDQKLSHDIRDLEAVFFSAQALGSLVNLQRKNMGLISQLPVVKGMFDWVCGIKPDMNYGACDIFYGAYEAGRPKFLGGDPEKGKEIFLSAIKTYPGNILIRVSYVQFYAIPMSDEDAYNDQKFYLETFSRNFVNGISWSPEKNGKEVMASHLNIYNSIAIERFEIIKKHEKDLF